MAKLDMENIRASMLSQLVLVKTVKLVMRQ